MSWFDTLMMVTTKNSGNLLDEADWRNVDNWAPRYSEAGEANRRNFILNEYIKGFEVGKSYNINVEFVDDSDLPINFYYVERTVVDNVWVQQQDATIYLTTTSIKTKSVAFTVKAEDYYYLLWTNRQKAEMESWLAKIKSIIVTEV